MERIQIITIIADLLFLLYISYLIIKGKLREEYAIVWFIITLFISIFSFWRKGLDIMSKIFGVYEPPNLVFTGFIFIILVYLLHLSVVSSKLHSQNKKITQELALFKEQLERIGKEITSKRTSL
jgi:hypothetical protein